MFEVNLKPNTILIMNLRALDNSSKVEHDIEEAIGSYSLSMNKPYVKESDHLYDVLKILSEYQLTVVPVVDREMLRQVSGERIDQLPDQWNAESLRLADHILAENAL